MALQLRARVVRAFADAQLNFEQLAACATLTGSGTPENVVKAPVGTLYTNRTGGAGSTLYVKESGTGNTGWVAK
jgi:hypothetical protein